jgi:type III secretion protein O
MENFGQLVSIKELRERKALRALEEQRAVLDAATAERDTADAKLREFREFAIEKERDMYRSLCERVVRLHEIEDARTEVLGLRSRETDHEDALQAAETRRDQEEEQLESDRHSHQRTVRIRDRFLELADIFAREEIVRAEQKQEAEIEEAAELRAGRPIATESAA